MLKRTKERVAGFAGAVALALIVAGPATAGDAGRVIATVNGVDITLGHVAVLREALPAQYQQLPDTVLYTAIVEQLIQQTLLAQAAEGKFTARDTVGLENSTRDFTARVALDGAVKAAITDEAVAEAYRTRFAEGEPATEYSASHILVATEEEAVKLRADLVAGAVFADKARELSTDRGSAANGGALGWFGLGMMVPPFEAAVIALKPGELSEPVQSQFGWHLISLTETRQAAVPTLDQVRAELVGELENAAVAARIAELTATATITRTDEGIDPALMRDQTLFDN